jgi:putative pyruvate formate lyase activating enzyme
MLVEALLEAVPMGLRLPLVYNTGAYDSLETIRCLEGIVDIYMPDFKFWTETSSKRYLNAPDYPTVAREVILEMHRQVGDLEVDDQGIARKGLLVRHLVMPGYLSETREILKSLAGVSGNTYVNIMDQYRPCGRAYEYEEIGRRIAPEEYRAAMGYAKEFGLRRLDARVRFFMVL